MMVKPLEITKAEYLEGYRLLVWFNDGALKVIDLAGYLHKPYLGRSKKTDAFAVSNLILALSFGKARLI
ncbi:MAG: hypothetical protein R3A44_36360 [Caldilineaceae bacterium]